MMPVRFAGNCPVHVCIDSTGYKEQIEVSVRRSEASQAIKRRWVGKIGMERVSK